MDQLIYIEQEYLAPTESSETPLTADEEFLLSLYYGGAITLLDLCQIHEDLGYSVARSQPYRITDLEPQWLSSKQEYYWSRYEDAAECFRASSI
jgi:hypothetical protein